MRTLPPRDMASLRSTQLVQLDAAALHQLHLNVARVEAMALKFLKTVPGVAGVDHSLPNSHMNTGGP